MRSSYQRVTTKDELLLARICTPAEGAFRSDLQSETTAALIVQAVLAAMRLRSFGTEFNRLPIDAADI